MKDFIILGGGNSGYISALILKKAFPEMQIQIIESKNIGIIGVGEGSTEHWNKFLNHVDINPLEMIWECGATYKAGIFYKNWKKKDYYHIVSGDYNLCHNDYSPKYGKLISENQDPIELVNRWFTKNEFPKIYIEKENDGIPPMNQFHLDSYKLNNFLRKVAKERGIVVTEDDIIDATLSEDTGDIISLKSKDKEYFSSFFVDCSGFKSHIMKNILGVKWVSYDKHFPLNSAMAWQSDATEIIDCYTTAEARDYGWTWKIPTQDRIGNGYVYSDSFATEDMILDEIERKYGKVEIQKKVKFNPGRLEKFWVKNCIGVGLSGSFVEPLEATSLTSVIQQMFAFTLYYPSKDDDRYNEIMNGMFDNIVDYVQLHYICDRNDTSFWKYCKNDLVLTDNIKRYLKLWKNRLPQRNEFNTPWAIFNANNYIIAFYSLGLFDTTKIKQEYDIMMSQIQKSSLNFDIEKLKNFEKNSHFFSHRKLLSLMKELC